MKRASNSDMTFLFIVITEDSCNRWGIIRDLITVILPLRDKHRGCHDFIIFLIILILAVVFKRAPSAGSEEDHIPRLLKGLSVYLMARLSSFKCTCFGLTRKTTVFVLFSLSPA